MAASLTLNFKGVDALQKKLNGLPKEILEEIDGEIETGLRRVEGIQKQRAPFNNRKLAQSIQYVKEKDGQHKLFSDAAYSVYMEFGTGTKVNTSISGNNLANVAASAYQAAKSREASGVKFYDSILAWVKRKGIAARYSVKTRKRIKSTKSDDKRERQAAFLIMRHIKKYGVKPQPFFFNSWFEERPKINKKIGDALRRALK
ncbi:MAG TPA: HK97 gp10 family phage protein [Chitinophagaceae bacterium]|nr:HK97 gp10 family phage protein [Chitinophagaceae bacterium]